MPQIEYESHYKIAVSCVVVASLSLLGSLFVIVLFFWNKKLRKFPFRYVFFLSISDLILSIGFIFVSDIKNMY
jgi:hypothetical protein